MKEKLKDAKVKKIVEEIKSLDDTENKLLLKLIRYCGKTKTAKLLGISRRSIYNKLKRYEQFNSQLA